MAEQEEKLDRENRLRRLARLKLAKIEKERKALRQQLKAEKRKQHDFWRPVRRRRDEPCLPEVPGGVFREPKIVTAALKKKRAQYADAEKKRKAKHEKFARINWVALCWPLFRISHAEKTAIFL